MEHEQRLIRDFDHWSVYLHENQCYLGGTILWARRKDALDFFDMTEEEKAEYFDVGKKLRITLIGLFRPNMFNYLTLANVTRHLHTHLIPRYESSRIFSGIEFTDKRWGKNPAPYDEKFSINDFQMMKIRDAVKREI